MTELRINSMSYLSPDMYKKCISSPTRLQNIYLIIVSDRVTRNSWK